jgi:hypothetical protein
MQNETCTSFDEPPAQLYVYSVHATSGQLIATALDYLDQEYDPVHFVCLAAMPGSDPCVLKGFDTLGSFGATNGMIISVIPEDNHQPELRQPQRVSPVLPNKRPAPLVPLNPHRSMIPKTLNPNPIVGGHSVAPTRKPVTAILGHSLAGHAIDRSDIPGTLQK